MAQLSIRFAVVDFKHGPRSMRWFGGEFEAKTKTWAFAGEKAETVWEYLERQGGITETGYVHTCALSSRLEGVRLVSAEVAL